MRLQSVTEIKCARPSSVFLDRSAAVAFRWSGAVCDRSGEMITLGCESWDMFCLHAARQWSSWSACVFFVLCETLNGVTCCPQKSCCALAFPAGTIGPRQVFVLGPLKTAMKKLSSSAIMDFSYVPFDPAYYDTPSTLCGAGDASSCIWRGFWINHNYTQKQCCFDGACGADAHVPRDSSCFPGSFTASTVVQSAL